MSHPEPPRDDTASYTIETLPPGAPDPGCDCGISDAVIRVDGEPLCAGAWASHSANAAVSALNPTAMISDASTIRGVIDMRRGEGRHSEAAIGYLEGLTDSALVAAVEEGLGDFFWREYHAAHDETFDGLLEKGGFAKGPDGTWARPVTSNTESAAGDDAL